ncbi:MAG: alpha/beta fold hydrolase [Lachnospiraceae bacterium]
MRKKIFKYSLVSIVLLAILVILGFLFWANEYYHAEEEAVMLLEEESIVTEKNLTILTPNTSNEIGIIFYPGAKVEAISYLPLLHELQNRNYTCVLVEMPLNMAIFNVNAAELVFDKVSNIKSWYMAGHSMGGAMASSYASKNPEKVEGLLLLGAYLYGEYSPEHTLMVYGSFNDDLEQHIDGAEHIVKIKGGNHAQFGNYGKQKKDQDATISTQEQQLITVEAICDFIENKSAF